MSSANTWEVVTDPEMAENAAVAIGDTLRVFGTLQERQEWTAAMLNRMADLGLGFSAEVMRLRDGDHGRPRFVYVFGSMTCGKCGERCRKAFKHKTDPTASQVCSACVERPNINPYADYEPIPNTVRDAKRRRAAVAE